MDPIDRIANCITEDANKLSGAYDSTFGDLGSYVIVNADTLVEYWDGRDWSTDLRRLHESVIDNLGDATILAEDVGGIVLRENFAKWFAKAILNIPEGMRRKFLKRYNVTDPSQDKRQYEKDILQIIEDVKQIWESSKSLQNFPFGEVFGEIVRSIITDAGSDITQQVKAQFRDIKTPSLAFRVLSRIR